MHKSKLYRYVLSLLSAILLVLAFPYTGSLPWLSFFAWIPLLFIEQEVYQKKYRSGIVFVHSYLTFLFYNIGTTWWIVRADFAGGILAFVFNALLMACTFQLFHWIKRKKGDKIGSFAFIFVWLSFEFLHYRWELSHPWLTLGNVFSIAPKWVQWYEYTGVLGGSLWILTVNILLFRCVKMVIVAIKNRTAMNRKKIAIPFIVVLLPLLLSLWMYEKYEQRGIQTELLVVQPNIDPYQKFSTISPIEQINLIVDLAEQKRTANTKLILAPETAMPISIDEDRILDDIGYRMLSNQIRTWVGTDVLIGAATERTFKTKQSRASKWDQSIQRYVEYYNSSVIIGQTENPEILHKSKLVLGAEKVPFSHFFPSMENWSIDMGGTTGTLGIEPRPKNSHSGTFPFTASICYESIYGEFTAQQTKLGSQAIFVITNDGWWGDTPGYKQHFSFARLRAIENRKSIARSANTGISGFINQRGDIIQQSEWWKTDVLKNIIFRNHTRTIYMRIGDLIGRIACLGAIVCFVYALFVVIQKRFLS